MIGMEAQQYLAFYKPYGVLTAFTDAEGRPTLKNYIDVPGVYPAGRLDFDSEGMLLLTDDGGLAHRLTDPRFNHPKTYLVQVEGTVTPQALASLAAGVEVKGQRTRKAQVLEIPAPTLPERAKPVTPHGPTAWLRIVLREGKKRQIRHMTAAVGLPTLRIVRIAIGPIALGDLQPGEWRLLTPDEVRILKESVKSAVPERKPSAKQRPTAGRTAGRYRTDEKPPETNPGGKPAKSRGSARGSRYRSGGRRSSGR